MISSKQAFVSKLSQYQSRMSWKMQKIIAIWFLTFIGTIWWLTLGVWFLFVERGRCFLIACSAQSRTCWQEWVGFKPYIIFDINVNEIIYDLEVIFAKCDVVAKCEWDDICLMKGVIVSCTRSISDALDIGGCWGQWSQNYCLTTAAVHSYIREIIPFFQLSSSYYFLLL